MLSSAARSDTARPQVTAVDLAERMVRLERGQRLAVVGSDRERLGEILATNAECGRSALLLVTEGLPTAAAALDRLLDDLAELALGRWPRWYGSDEAIGDPPDRYAMHDPVVSGPWLRAAIKRVQAGQRPRFRRAAPETELVQLLHAVDPRGVILITEIDPVCARRAAPIVEALERCAAHGASVVAALPFPPHAGPPYDRILYGACDLVRPIVPAAARFIAPSARAHHASIIEQRVEAALRRDPELADLFRCNAVVPLGTLGAHARVDLLCRAHRIVVEFDGPEHRAPANFANDRHRDYELLVAGYLVLRITNEQVEADLQQAIAKIRAVVRLRRTSEGAETG